MKLTMFNTIRSVSNPPTVNDFQLDIPEQRYTIPIQHTTNRGIMLQIDNIYQQSPEFLGYTSYLAESGPQLIIGAAKHYVIETNQSTESPPWKISIYNNSPYYVVASQYYYYDTNPEHFFVINPKSLLDIGQAINLQFVLYTKWGGIVSN